MLIGNNKSRGVQNITSIFFVARNKGQITVSQNMFGDFFTSEQQLTQYTLISYETTVRFFIQKSIIGHLFFAKMHKIQLFIILIF